MAVVLRPGDPDRVSTPRVGHSLFGECRQCGCRFETRTYTGYRTGDEGWRITCPQLFCGRLVYTHHENKPESWDVAPVDDGVIAVL